MRILNSSNCISLHFSLGAKIVKGVVDTSVGIIGGNVRFIMFSIDHNRGKNFTEKGILNILSHRVG